MDTASLLARGLKKPVSIKILRAISLLLPGDWLKTFVFLNCIHRPRKILRSLLFDFYRMDHVYDVVREFIGNHRGRFTILEFGVAEGYSFVKKLYATRYLNCEDRITIHGFDTFEGMPKASVRCDRGLRVEDSWVEGQYRSDFRSLQEHCAARYRNFVLHKGLFDTTITKDLLRELRTAPPILVWIDCDYYSSAKIALERVMPALPSGCVIYFDEPYFNYGSRFTGEAKLIHEINTGLFGEGIELVPDLALSLDSNRIYRFINMHAATAYEPLERKNFAEARLLRNNGSPFP